MPITVQAFTGQALAELNIKTLDDLLKYTPNVTFGNNGPGQGDIFMRGLTHGFRGNQSSATIGNFPNVAIYLDDQSMQFPARNVDIYMVDMERVEVLEGPQGTLFGGGAEAGAVRYITNKPNLDAFEGNAEASYGFTAGGAANSAATRRSTCRSSTDKLAVRAVIYDDHQGGYIDNVPSTFTRSNQDLGNIYFGIHRRTGGLCPNGTAGGGAAGLCTLPERAAGQQLRDRAEELQSGDIPGRARLGALRDQRRLERPDHRELAEPGRRGPVGRISRRAPTSRPLQPLQVTSFTPSYDKDRYSNTAWTVNGKIGDSRRSIPAATPTAHINEQMDYTNYSRSAGGMYYAVHRRHDRLRQRQRRDLLLAGRLLARHGPQHPPQQRIPRQHAGRLAPPRHRRRYQEKFRIYDV